MSTSEASISVSAQLMLILPPTFSTTLFSVTTASISSAGVTSKDGLGWRGRTEGRETISLRRSLRREQGERGGPTCSIGRSQEIRLRPG